MVYNKLDQLVASQDGLQRINGKWLYTKYDAFGRVTSTGMYASTSTRSALQDDQNNIAAGTPLWESRTSGDYSNDRFPTGNTTPLTINYYDDYSYPGSLGAPAGTEEVSGQRIKTLLTGTKIYKTDGTAPLMTSNYYDKDARLIRSKEENHLGGTDEVINTYSFAGELISSTRTHIVNSQTTTIAMRYEYDHAGRKIATMQSINGQAEVVLSKLDYNELGQLNKKNLHSADGTNFIQNTEYAYNERGWLKGINDPNNVSASKVFGMTLNYANKADAYNGNIGSVGWKTKVPAGLGLTENLQSYTYNYDKLNRLEKAGYTTAGQVDKYNEELSYDLMGNILTLKRTKGSIANFNDLTYNYTQSNQAGNRLYGVTDAIGNHTSTYTYDVNGNQITNSKLGITSIGYNYLNLPQVITKAASGETLNYIYDATGQKLRKQFGTQITDYAGGIQYTNNSIEFIQTEEGRAIPGSSYTYEYFLKDHLGNTRAVVKQDGTITQVQDYYAFGLEMNPGNQFAGSPVNRYTYNGKEKQVELSLNQLDYGARFYDPVIGRWTAIDRKSEMYFSHSSYVYALNTPVNAVDPDGNIVIFINGQHTGDGASGYKKGPNWRGTNDYWRNGKQSFDLKVMERLRDNNAIYRDGSMGGFLNTLTIGGNLNANRRRDEGYHQGMEDAKRIIESLARDKQGNISETIKVISHSMGGSYAKGYIEAILEYARRNKIAGVNVAFEADFAPFQPDKQKAVKGVPTFQFSHSDDMIAGDEQMPGAKKMNTSADKKQDHSIFGFIDQIKNLPAGNYKVINGKIVPAS